MKLDLDKSDDVGSIRLAVQWLRTMMRRDTWIWNEEQRKNCAQIADEVEGLLLQDVPSDDLRGRLHELMHRCRVEKHDVKYADLVALLNEG